MSAKAAAGSPALEIITRARRRGDFRIMTRRVQFPSAPASAGPPSRRGLWLLFIAAAAVPISLLWDFSWESTVGIDLFWSPPHALTYASMALAGAGALALMFLKKSETALEPGTVRLGRLQAPLGGWLVLWS